jgi:hypothetical protein
MFNTQTCPLPWWTDQCLLPLAATLFATQGTFEDEMGSNVKV